MADGGGWRVEGNVSFWRIGDRASADGRVFGLQGSVGWCGCRRDP